MFFSCVDICFEITHEFARNLPKMEYVGFLDSYITSDIQVGFQVQMQREGKGKSFLCHSK